MSLPPSKTMGQHFQQSRVTGRSGVLHKPTPFPLQHWDQCCLRWPGKPPGVACSRTRHHRRQGANWRSRQARNPPKICQTGSRHFGPARVETARPTAGFSCGQPWGSRHTLPCAKLFKRTSPPGSRKGQNAMPCWRHCRAEIPALDAESGRKDDGLGGERKPSETGPASGRIQNSYYVPGGRGPEGGGCQHVPERRMRGSPTRGGPHVRPDDLPNHASKPARAAPMTCGSAEPTRSGADTSDSIMVRLSTASTARTALRAKRRC